MIIRASRRFKAVGLMALCAVAQVSSADLSDFSLTSDPYFSGGYFQVSDSEYMQDLGLDIPGDHFAISPFLFRLRFHNPNHDTNLITYFDDLPRDFTFSYQNYDQEWYTYDHEVDGPFSDWYNWLLDNVDVKAVLSTTSEDRRLRLELPSSTERIPGIPAPSGIALLALSGLACSRRRR